MHLSLVLSITNGAVMKMKGISRKAGLVLDCLDKLVAASFRHMNVGKDESAVSKTERELQAAVT
jgi:hypothetical protein